MKIYKRNLVIECTTEEYLEYLKLKDFLYKPKPKTGEVKCTEKSNDWANTCHGNDWYMKLLRETLK